MNDVSLFFNRILHFVIFYSPPIAFITLIFSLLKIVKWENCPRRQKRWKICAIVSGILVVLGVLFALLMFQVIMGV